MSGLSRLTALEIFSNPRDLEITIGQEDGRGKFTFAIFRGPGHNFKLMLSSQPFAETQDEIVSEIGRILQFVCEFCTKELMDKGGFIHELLNPEGQEFDQSQILNQGQIDRILEELRQHKKASTHEMFVAAS